MPTHTTSWTDADVPRKATFRLKHKPSVEWPWLGHGKDRMRCLNEHGDPISWCYGDTVFSSVEFRFETSPPWHWYSATREDLALARRDSEQFCDAIAASKAMTTMDEFLDWINGFSGEYPPTVKDRATYAMGLLEEAYPATYKRVFPSHLVIGILHAVSDSTYTVSNEADRRLLNVINVVLKHLLADRV